MASAWGTSFGSAWGNSWGALAGVVAPIQPSGGWLHVNYGNKRRTKKEIEQARRKFGLVFEVIKKVAKRQSQDLHLDEQQRFEELYRELKLQNLEFEASYLTLLNNRREHLINVEIGVLLRKRILEEEEAIFMLLVVSNL